MKLSVIILNWNRLQETLNCIQSVRSWTHIAPEIWVVDNASEDESAQKIPQKFPGIHFILSDQNRGFAGGNNLALEQILTQDFDLTLLLNNDATISEENILKLIKSLQAHKSLGIVGPLLYSEGNNSTPVSVGGQDIGRYISTRKHISKSDLSDLSSKDHIYRVDYVPGSVALIRTELFSPVGLLDEDYFFSGEIADFCERIKKTGYFCAIELDSQAIHNVNTSSPLRSTLYLYYNIRNRFLFVRKFKSQPFLFLTFWSLVGLAMFASAVVKLRFAQARSVWLGLIDGIFKKYGNQNNQFLN